MLLLSFYKSRLSSFSTHLLVIFELNEVWNKYTVALNFLPLTRFSEGKFYYLYDWRYIGFPCSLYLFLDTLRFPQYAVSDTLTHSRNTWMQSIWHFFLGGRFILRLVCTVRLKSEVLLWPILDIELKALYFQSLCVHTALRQGEWINCTLTICIFALQST